MLYWKRVPFHNIFKALFSRDLNSEAQFHPSWYEVKTCKIVHVGMTYQIRYVCYKRDTDGGGGVGF